MNDVTSSYVTNFNLNFLKTPNPSLAFILLRLTKSSIKMNLNRFLNGGERETGGERKESERAF